MKVTIDSTEPLEDALRVIGALYDVTLTVEPQASATSSANRPAAPRAASTARGRKSSRPRRTAARRNGSGQKAGGASPSNSELRAWARQHGYTVADRGRVPAAIVLAYRSAHPN